MHAEAAARAAGPRRHTRSCGTRTNSPRWEPALGELAGGAGRTGTVLRPAGSTSSPTMLVIPAFAHLRAGDPGLDVRVAEVETADAYGRLLAGEADIAVTLPNLGGPAPDDPRFDQQPLLDEPQDLLVSRDHPLAGRASVSLEEAAHRAVGAARARELRPPRAHDGGVRGGGLHSEGRA